MPTAEAAFPGRNGRIALEVVDEINGLTDTDIFTFLPNGAGVQQMTSGPELDIRPAWSPDGRAIAFERLLFPAPADIYVISNDTLDNLTNTPTSWESGPAWSPDATRIAFAAIDFGNFLQGFNLYVMDADGGNPRQIAQGVGGANPGPSWSPDGRWIAYVDGSSNALRLVAPDGSRNRALNTTMVNGEPEFPDWSPDGGRIAFSVRVPGRLQGPRADVWVVNVDGSGLTNLTKTVSTDDFGPAWSPNGKKILYISNAEKMSYYLYRMNADGTSPKRVLDIELTAGVGHPSWGTRS